jgi:hypothetical protein
MCYRDERHRIACVIPSQAKSIDEPRFVDMQKVHGDWPVLANAAMAPRHGAAGLGLAPRVETDAAESLSESRAARSVDDSARVMVKWRASSSTDARSRN